MSVAVTAAKLSLATCHTCGQLNRVPDCAHAVHCPRCHAALHLRKPDSVGRAWALVIAAFILYIPANVLPITITRSIVGVQADTILSGVVYFWTSGSYDLAIIIFTASIFVPLAKLLTLSFLLISVQRRWRWEPLQRLKLFRMVEFIGKWSMLDVFVVALLATLVEFSSLATISAGPGIIAFGAVVVLTLFAAWAFDPRLIWDPVSETAAGTNSRG